MVPISVTLLKQFFRLNHIGVQPSGEIEPIILNGLVVWKIKG